jgi:hypothetical protein
MSTGSVFFTGLKYLEFISCIRTRNNNRTISMIISNNRLLKQFIRIFRQLRNESRKTKCEKYTINAHYTRSIDCPKKKLKGENCKKAKGDCPDRVCSDQMVRGTVSWGGWTT